MVHSFVRLFLATALALTLVSVERLYGYLFLESVSWTFSGGAEGARALLGSVAGSVMFITGTTFSITIAVLSFTSTATEKFFPKEKLFAVRRADAWFD